MEKSTIKKKMANITSLVLVFALLILTMMAFLFSNPDFNIEFVELYGAAELYSGDIFKIIDDQLNQNIVLADIQTKEEAISNISEIKKAQIRRIFPNRLEIFIVEHQPIVLINLEKIYGLTKERILIPFDDPSMIPDLPIISGLSSYIEAKEFSEIQSYALKDIIIFIESVKNIQPDLLVNISEINYSYEQGISIRMIPDGLAIVIGKKKQYEDKIEKLIHSLPAVYCERERLKIVDLRFEDRVILKFKEGYKG
ncbi:MAG: cell division protein FtsQ/DivIB [Candidatus Zixiibacteriota bacterium]